MKNSKPICLLILLFLFSYSCKKDNIENEINLNTLIDGWGIYENAFNHNILYLDIYFINPKIGFITGHDGIILKTIDSARTWNELNSGTTLDLYSVYFLDENNGYVSGYAMTGCLDEDCDKASILLKTKDGGQKWEKIFLDTIGNLSYLKFFDVNNGLALMTTNRFIGNEQYKFVVKSVNGGITWDIIDLDLEFPKLHYVENNICFISDYNKIGYKSQDQGKMWKKIETPKDEEAIYKYYFINENFWFITGEYNIYKTTDGGYKWNIINPPFSYFQALHFSDEYNGFNIETKYGYNGGTYPTLIGIIIYTTNDGGINWAKSELITNLLIGNPYFFRSDFGYSLTENNFYIWIKE